MRDADYDVVVRDGAWVNGLSVTWPFARLLVSPAQIEPLVLAAEPIRIVRAEVIGLRRLYGPLGSSAQALLNSGSEPER
jgi:hypothetical protein